jgi:hypothetical protein
VPTLTFKVTLEEAARIRRLARRERRTVSEFLRRRALQDGARTADDASGYRVEPSAVTGLAVMHAPAGTPAVTPEQIKALTADFP